MIPKSPFSSSWGKPKNLDEMADLKTMMSPYLSPPQIITHDMAFHTLSSPTPRLSEPFERTCRSDISTKPRRTFSSLAGEDDLGEKKAPRKLSGRRQSQPGKARCSSRLTKEFADEAAMRDFYRTHVKAVLLKHKVERVAQLRR